MRHRNLQTFRSLDDRLFPPLWVVGESTKRVKRERFCRAQNLGKVRVAASGNPVPERREATGDRHPSHAIESDRDYGCQATHFFLRFVQFMLHVFDDVRRSFFNKFLVF